MRLSDWQPGDRVEADGKPGAVHYLRRAPPDYTEVAAVSVRLDEHEDRRGYGGTVFTVRQVRFIERPVVALRAVEEVR